VTNTQIVDFENVLSLIDKMIEAGEDPWFVITEALASM
jgi:hypothetical protein